MTKPETGRLASLSGSIATAVACLGLALSSCATSQGAWQRAQELDTQEAYSQVVEDFPGSVYATYAQQRLGELHEARDWADAQAAGSKTAFESFLATYPQSKNAPQAKKTLHALMQAEADVEWARVQATDWVSEHQKFIDRFPLASQVPEATQYIYDMEMGLAWEVASGQEDIAYYVDFLSNFPVSPHRAEAEAKVLAMRQAKEGDLPQRIKQAITDATRSDTIQLRQGDYLKNITVEAQRSILSYGGDYLHADGTAYARLKVDDDVLVPIDLGFFDVLETRVKAHGLKDVIAHYEDGDLAIGYRVDTKGFLTLVLPNRDEPFELELQGALYTLISMP